jgi:hypothetical protein
VSQDNFVTRALVVGAYVGKVAIGQADDIPAALEQLATAIITLVIAGVGLAFGTAKKA